MSIKLNIITSHHVNYVKLNIITCQFKCQTNIIRCQFKCQANIVCNLILIKQHQTIISCNFRQHSFIIRFRLVPIPVHSHIILAAVVFPGPVLHPLLLISRNL